MIALPSGAAFISSQSSGAARVVAFPPLTAAEKQTPKFTERVTIGTDEATITGDGLKDVTKVTIQKRDLATFEVGGDGKSLTLKGLVANGATTATRTVNVELATRDGVKIKVPLEVVTSKVELIQSK